MCCNQLKDSKGPLHKSKFNAILSHNDATAWSQLSSHTWLAVEIPGFLMQHIEHQNLIGLLCKLAYMLELLLALR